MFVTGSIQLLHLFFAFSFVGSLMVSEWNGRAARATEDWGLRATQFGIVRLSTRIGFGALVLTGVFGNLSAMRHGYPMSDSTWLAWVNGLWLVAVVVMAALVMPNLARLAAMSRSAAGGERAEGFARALARWRFGNVLLSLLYLAMLVLMVFPWRA
jgi:hypothetical protein